MCKSVVSAGVAALCFALSASAQTARLDVQVSSDNVNWGDSMFAPAGSTVYVRVVATTDAPGVVGFASATFQPTISNWSNGDLRLPFTSSTSAIPSNEGEPAYLGRMSPFGSVSMGNGSTSGQLSTFVDSGTTMRVAGSRATTMTSNLAYGVVSSQISKSLAGNSYNASLSPVILKFGFQVSNSPDLRTMIATIPLASVQNARTQWHTSLITGTGNPTNIPLTAADIDPATIYVGPPNLPPVAVPDSFAMLEDQTLFVTNASILDNDTDPDANETKTAELVQTTANGALTFNPNGTFSYIPNPDYNGIETFTYRVRDRYNAASNIGTVTITVTDVNDSPDFTAASPSPISEDSGLRTINGWAQFNPGSGEPGQGVDRYEVMGVGNPALFAVPPTISADGTLTYTPAPDMNGASSFQVRVQDTGGTSYGGVDVSTPSVFTIDVMAVNDPPTFAASPVPAINEDAGQQSLSHWASFNPGPNEADQTLLGFSVSNVSNPSLFSVLPTIAPDGTLVYTPAPNAAGTSTFTVTARDSGGTGNGGIDTSSPQVFTINIAQINDPPTFTATSPAIINEDSSAQTLNNWAVFNSGGGVAEASQVAMQYIVTNISNPSLFSVLPSVSTTGQLTYTAAPDAFGTATFHVQVRDNGGTASGGADLSAPQTFTVTINAVNDQPTFTASNQSGFEDAGPVSVSGWAAFNAGGGDFEASQSVQSYIVSNVINASLFSVQPTVQNDGTLTYTVAPNASGNASFTVRVRDNGGTAFGGVDLSASQTFTISISALNDAPIVTVGTAPTVIEDAGSQTVFNFASFNAGAANESSQSVVQYVVSNVSNPAMFSAGPNISNSGILTYTPAPNASGTATFNVQARDNGGTANGGVDLSNPVVATVNITDINDPPTFAASNVSGTEDSGAMAIASWSAFNPGPFETTQTALAYTVSNVSNPGLFASPPTVAANGSLSFTPAPDASGSSTFQVRVRDSGGTASGGVDLSSPQTFTVNIAAVNDAPIVTLSPIPTIDEDAPLQNVPGFAAFNAGSPNESGQSVLEYIISNVSNPASFVAGPVISPSGMLMYAPAPNASGAITFNVQVRDNGGTDNGGIDLSQPRIATINIVGVNDPPVAIARDITIDARNGCVPLSVPPSVINNGSYDADNPVNELVFSVDHVGEYPIGTTTVQLTVRDPEGLSASTTARVTVLALDTNNNGIPDSCDIVRGGGGPDCDGDGDNDESQCLWDNGSASAVMGVTNGQLSQYGGRPSARVADDFYLPPGMLYRITSFRAQMVTNSIERGARLSLFRDCDGSPYMEPFFTFDTEEIASEAPTSSPGFALVTYVFNLCESKLVLDGDQTYWVSIQGKVNCNETDQAFWAIRGVDPEPRDMIGSVPVKAEGLGDYPCEPDGYESWTSIADCCIGCVNMAYLLTGETCQLLWDNGPIDLGANTRGGDASGINRGIFSRAADNISIKPCQDEEVCFIQAWIWTNCSPVQGFIEFYDNLCAMPVGAYVHRAVPTDVIPLEGQFLTIDGVQYQGYRLEFWNVPFHLTRNKNYWVSVGADGAGSFNARSFFAFSDNTDPCTSCERRHITYGATLPNRQSSNVWQRGSREYAFRIATKPFYLETVPVPPNSFVNRCPSDFNHDEVSTIQDFFDFINAFFAGCP